MSGFPNGPNQTVKHLADSKCKANGCTDLSVLCSINESTGSELPDITRTSLDCRCKWVCCIYVGCRSCRCSKDTLRGVGGIVDARCRREGAPGGSEREEWWGGVVVGELDSRIALVVFSGYTVLYGRVRFGFGRSIGTTILRP
jgi:hypothetical protein